MQTAYSASNYMVVRIIRIATQYRNDRVRPTTKVTIDCGSSIQG